MSDIVRWLRARQEMEQRHVLTVSGASEAAELYGGAANEIDNLRASVAELEAETEVWRTSNAALTSECLTLRARVAELEARVRPVNGYGIALMMIAEGVNDPRHFAKDTLAKWRPIINAGIST